ncbi:MAG: 50S ribosomal protein L31 [bacterium]|nr:50S ribosomal protein L31 [Candidatus Kapabacteria bacterium]
MKEGIHPNYVAARVTCICGNEFTTKSTIGDIRLEICSECHPFYTGRQKVIDTAGRIDRFNQRFQRSVDIKAGKTQTS